MFRCSSYIKKPKYVINNLENINIEWEKYFVNIGDKEKINSLVNDIDLDFLEGAIYLCYGSEVIIDFKMWDYVDQLWAYIIEMIEICYKTGKAEMLFPDQPIKISFENIKNGYMILRVDKCKWILPYKEFISVLLNESEHFYKNIIANINVEENVYEYELGKIHNLRNILFDI